MKTVRTITVVVLSVALGLSGWTGSFAAAADGSGQSDQISGASGSISAGKMLKGRKYAKDELILTFSDDTSNRSIRKTASAGEADCSQISRIGSGEKSATVEISKDDTMKEAIVKFQHDSRVEAVQPNYRYSSAAADPYLDENNGANYQYQLKAVKAKAAWDELKKENNVTATGAHAVTTVAVIDTGIDTTHEDLQKNVLYGKDASGDNCYRQIVSGGAKDSTEDSDEHGTHVSGIIGATYGNGRGGSGVASGYDNDLVKIMPLGISENGQYMYTDDICRAIEYAAENGAKVVNMSLGGYGRDRVTEKVIESAFNGEYQYNGAGNKVTFVAAAGNDGTDKYGSPGDDKAVIDVCATNALGTPTSWSDYGISKDVSAPGDAVMSTVPGGYEKMSGTSMASPVTAGVVALMLDANPQLTPAQVYNILCATAKDIEETGFDIHSGYGIIDAEAAVKAAKTASTNEAVTGLLLKEDNLTLSEGDDHSLEALIEPATSLKSATWQSSDSSVATVDQSSGRVTAVKAGKATITAVADGKSAECSVTVKAANQPKGICIYNDSGKAIAGVDKDLNRVKEQPLTIALGSTYDLSADIWPEDSANKEVYWSTKYDDGKDASAAVESEGGQLIARKEGTVTVTARAYNSLNNDSAAASVKVTVKPAVSDVTLTKTASWIQLGDTYTFGARALNNKGGTDLANSGITWRVSNRYIARIDQSGKVTPKKTGTVNIMATASETVNYTAPVRTYKRIIIAKKNYSGKRDYALKKKKLGRHSATIRWKRIPIACGYRVQRAAGAGHYKTIKFIKSGRKTVCRAVGLKAGHRYRFRVKACYYKNRNGNGALKWFSYSNKLRLQTKW